jgi:ABC-2 type transport system ATP-binding protein
MENYIQAEALTKTYRIPVRDAGLLSAAKSLLKPVYNEVAAVGNLNFTIRRGEMVGFIGPNGAGKTTTLKMLSGLLYPTSGRVTAGGFVPYERKPEYLKNIGMLMGNKSQLTWDNTIRDSYLILKEIYAVPDKVYKKRFEELVGLLELESLLGNLARNLSLGERAKCELAAALIHNPGILYLDEPTLGLDVTMQLRFRNFIREYNQKYGTTVILTSHYMSDISSLCSRVLLIHRGSLLFEGELSALAEKTMPFRLVRFSLSEGTELEPSFSAELPEKQAEPVETQEPGYCIRVRKEKLLELTSFLIERYSLADLAIENPPIEAVIDQVYREGVQQ